MIQIYENQTQTGVKKYICDTSDELSKIDLRTTLMGSTCYVIGSDSTYMLNGSYQWVKIRGFGWTNQESSGGSGGDDSYIYDGGEITNDNSDSSDNPNPENNYIWDGGEVS